MSGSHARHPRGSHNINLLFPIMENFQKQAINHNVVLMHKYENRGIKCLRMKNIDSAIQVPLGIP